MVRRFNRLAWASLLLAILTGLWRAGPLLATPAVLTTTPFGQGLLLKMALVAALLGLTAVHSILIGPRLLSLLETDPASADGLARLSRVVSVLTFLLTLAVFGAMTRLSFGTF